MQYCFRDMNPFVSVRAIRPWKLFESVRGMRRDALDAYFDRWGCKHVSYWLMPPPNFYKNQILRTRVI